VNAQTTVCCEHVPRIADNSMLQETLVDSLVPGKTKGEKRIIRGRPTDLDTIILSFTTWRLVGAVGWRVTAMWSCNVVSAFQRSNVKPDGPRFLRIPDYQKGRCPCISIAIVSLNELDRMKKSAKEEVSLAYQLRDGTRHR
jgi:hypothetical protein